MAAHGLASFDQHSSAAQGAEAARRELSALALRYARPNRDRWAMVPFEIDLSISTDAALAEAAFRARSGLIHEVSRRLGPLLPDPLLPDPLLPRYCDALLRVPRERFVLPEDIALSVNDT